MPRRFGRSTGVRIHHREPTNCAAAATYSSGGMGGPMSYGLYPTRRPNRHKSANRVSAQLRAAQRDECLVGTSRPDVTGACCIPCRRYIDSFALRVWGNGSPSRILPEECCSFCGRTQLDQELFAKGALEVARMQFRESERERLGGLLERETG